MTNEPIPPDDSADDDGEMPWENEARVAIERAAQGIELDEPRGVVYAESGVDHHFDPIQEGFSSSSELWDRLTEIGEEAWISSTPFEGGEPVFEPIVDGMVESALDWQSIEAFFARIAAPEETEELIRARDLLIPKGGLAVQLDLATINEELIRYLARHLEKMRDLHPRAFEELVAELFKDKGYDVEVTPQTRDGGFDIRAYSRSDVGVLLGLIECKRFAATSRVLVDIVRGLYGVVENVGANFGLIATTSTFTRDAKSFQQQNRYRVQLADLDELTRWLNSYRGRR